jgi:hypothetical protein
VKLDCWQCGQNELNGRDEGPALIVAARHTAIHHRTATRVLALQGLFKRSRRILSAVVILGRMPARRAHPAGTAIHAIRLKGRSPKWSPEKQNRQQTYRCSHLLSRRDTSVERRVHLVVEENTANTKNPQLVSAVPFWSAGVGLALFAVDQIRIRRSGNGTAAFYIS